MVSTSKRSLQLRLGARNGIPASRCRKNFGVMDSTTGQIAREGDAAIFEQRWTGCAEPSVCFEVVRVKRRDGFHIGGRFVGPAEVYPNSEAWGLHGFTFTDRDAAFAKLRELA
jgi:hypothetical protein